MVENKRSLSVGGWHHNDEGSNTENLLEETPGRRSARIEQEN